MMCKESEVAGNSGEASTQEDHEDMCRFVSVSTISPIDRESGLCGEIGGRKKSM